MFSQLKVKIPTLESEQGQTENCEKYVRWFLRKNNHVKIRFSSQKKFFIVENFDIYLLMK